VEPSAPQPPPGSSADAKTALLESIASGGDRWVKIGTLALVALTGGGNFLATTKTSEYNADEIRRGLFEIHNLHDQLQSTIDRQKDMYRVLQDIDRRTSRDGYPLPQPNPSPQ
jgi:hypothetical protein